MMPHQSRKRLDVDTDLWPAYRSSFENFVRQAAAARKAAHKFADKNEEQLEQARTAYSQARNALAETFLEKQPRQKTVCAQKRP